MVLFYQHKTNMDQYIFYYSDDLDINTSISVDKFASSNFQKGNIQLLSILSNGTHITEKKAIFLLAETNKRNEENLVYSDTVGLVGIQKLLYKMFLKASNSKTTQRVFDTVRDLQQFHCIEVFNDFHEIKF